MKCIIVDDEPIARKGIEKLVRQIPDIEIAGSFPSAESASLFMNAHPVDLVFLDIQMQGISGLEFARYIPKKTLVIFTTAFSEYAVDSYEVEAIDYLVKPIQPACFAKAVEKASAYHALLAEEQANEETVTPLPDEKTGTAGQESIFIKADRRYQKVRFNEILFVEGLKDYVILQLADRKIITHMNLKAIQALLPPALFLRVNRSYIVNMEQIDSFDIHDIFIHQHEIAIGNSYRDTFLEEFVSKRL